MAAVGTFFDELPPLRMRGRQSTAPMPNIDWDSEDDLNADQSRERNRCAAKKWRDKRERYLIELESENDELRKKALHLSSEIQCLSLTNRVLEKELAFFQSFVSVLMRKPASH
jgi:hypothetical protein